MADCVQLRQRNVSSARLVYRGLAVLTIAVLAIAALVAFEVLLFSRTALADAELSGTTPAQWRLVWTGDPSTSASILWTTAEPGEKHHVHYHLEGADPQSAAAARSGKYSGGDTYYHHVELADLEPGAKYFVTLQSDDARSRRFHFVTAPAEDKPFSLFFGGDSRSGREARRSINQILAKIFAEQPRILALVHGGDYIVWGISFSQWSAWMTDHELTTTEEGRLLPIIPARGNHDRGPMFNEVFGFPAEDENYYGLNITPQVRLLTLNTNISTAGDQRRWLEEQLSKWRPQVRWLLAQYHRPAYPAVKSPSSAKRDWVPLFEKYNLDLACEADGHCIKRTPPIRADQQDPTGVVYIGEGGLGVGQRTPKIEDRWYLQSPGKTGRGHHVQLLSFEDQKLNYRVVLLGEEVFDEHTIEARSPQQ